MTSSTPVLPSARASMPEIWKRSLIAIFGLGASFAAALFSTVTRDAGNVFATAILAGGSLLVSIWVGMTTVPISRAGLSLECDGRIRSILK